MECLIMITWNLLIPMLWLNQTIDMHVFKSFKCISGLCIVI